jgi:hypothetical protein
MEPLAARNTAYSAAPTLPAVFAPSDHAPRVTTSRLPGMLTHFAAVTNSTRLGFFLRPFFLFPNSFPKTKISSCANNARHNAR